MPGFAKAPQAYSADSARTVFSAGSRDETVASGKEIFVRVAQPPCALCHALRDAGSSAEIGPALDELVLDKPRVVTALRSGVGVMPSYDDKLTDAEIDAVAEYVIEATARPKQ